MNGRMNICTPLETQRRFKPRMVQYWHADKSWGYVGNVICVGLRKVVKVSFLLDVLFILTVFRQ